MRNIFNTVAKFRRGVCAFNAALGAVRSGVNPEIVLSSMDMLKGKEETLSSCIAREHREVVERLFINTLESVVDHVKGSPENWSELIYVMDEGLKKTEEGMGGEEEHVLASLGRLRNSFNIFKNWYIAEDKRLLPLYESLGKISGMNQHLFGMFPSQTYTGKVCGIDLTVEIS